MSKTNRRTKTQKKAAKETFFSKFNLEEFIPHKYHILAAILVIFILFLIFLNPLYFGDRTFQAGDIMTSKSIEPYVQNHDSGYTLWDPYIFCGMPAYAIGTSVKWFNLIYLGIYSVKEVFKGIFSVEYAQWTLYLIILGITTFFLVKYLTKNTLVSLFSAVSTSFSMGIIVFLFIGHVTKLAGLAFYPLIFLILLKFQNKIRLIDILILIITLQLSIQSFHVQIIFYTLFAVTIYFIYFFIRALVKKETENRNNILKSAGVFIFSLIIALLMQSDNITQIYEYTPYSTRGTESILDKTSGKVEQNTSEYYKYHTDWSFSPGEVLTFIVPSYYGFGYSEYNGPLTNNQSVRVNTYFGQMPFVDVAVGYMGIIVFVLALFGIFTRWKDPFVQFLTILSGIALIISFGKNFPVLFDLLFYNLPGFNKFRVPSMILVLIQVSIPVLAGLGLMRIISLRNENNEKLKKVVKNLAIGFSAVFVLSLLLNGAVTGWFAGRVNDYAASIQQTQPRMAQQFNALADYSAGMFSGDLLFAFAFLALTFWTAVGYINMKISGDILTIIIILMTVIDLWRIDARGEDYINNPDLKNLFTQPDYITAIKDQNDKEPFRILNLKQDGSYGSFNNNANYNAYFLLEDFYGYSAIKPRSYQDIIDVIGPANPTLWRMLNVKYLVTDKQINFKGFSLIHHSDKELIYKYEDALSRVYFVDSVGIDTGMNLLNKIKNLSFDPKKIAFTDKQINVDLSDSTAYSKIVEYKDELIKVEANASGNNFLFLGDTYLPYGWKASIDGNKTKIYKADYGFMGIIVPKGKHTVEFTYAPESFYISKYIVLIFSYFVIIGLIVTIIFNSRKKNNSVSQS
ncbi:MAG: YfhO family protein [Ignavibacteriaceae bacterium]